MIGNKKVRILWLSDIHFADAYSQLKGKKPFSSFLDSFIAKVVELQSQSPFSYIFITGDLAFSGSNNDYNRLDEMLLRPLLQEFRALKMPIPKLLTIPGNHDVNWDEDEFMHRFIKTRGEANKVDFLVDNEDKFRNLFKDYTDFFTSAGFKTLEPFLKLENSKAFKVSKEYKKSRLFGHIIDKKNNLIVVMLNSAWFSLGIEFNRLFVKVIEEYKDLTESDPGANDNLIQLFAIKDKLSEYNGQITGIQLMNESEDPKEPKLESYFNNYQDYFVILCMHHPRNWLEWTESYVFPGDTSEKNSAKLLNKLIRNANLFLTGHEHVPADIREEWMLGSALHLKAGCLLEDNQVENCMPKKISFKDKFPKSWFSVLDIGLGSKIVSQQKYQYNEKKAEWNLLNILPSEHPMMRSFNGKLTDERNNKNINTYNRAKPRGLVNFLADYLDIESSAIKLDIVSQVDGYNLYNLTYGGNNELVVQALEEDPWSFCFKHDNFKKLLAQLLHRHTSVGQVRFITLDLLADGNTKQRYREDYCEREQVYNDLVRDLDILFNVFRHGFFSQWEPLVKEDFTEKMAKEFSRFTGVTFVNQVIPYWLAEYYWI